MLEAEPSDKILSSGYLRCVQTVEPLANRRKLSVEPVTELEEGAGADGVVRLMQKFPGRNIVLCTHGDVMEELLEGLIAQGILQRARAYMEKGSTWVLEEQDGKVTGAKYLPAP